MATKEEWISVLRSTVGSFKGDITFSQLIRDAEAFAESNMNFRSFGYRTAQEMIADVPGLKIITKNGMTIVKAQVTEETRHIANLLQNQRPSRKRRSRKIKRFNRFHYQSQSNNNRKTSTSFSKPYSYNNSRNQNSRSSGFTSQRNSSSAPLQTSRNSLVSTPQPNPPIARKATGYAIPEEKPSQNKSFNHNNSANVSPKQNLPAPPQKFTVPQQKVATPQLAIPCKKPKSLDPRMDLLQYSKLKKLSDPVYKVQITKHREIYASVTIEEKQTKWNSFPTSATSKEEAEKLAATAALEELLKQESEILSITQNSAVIIDRILEILKKHPHLFESKLIEIYRYNYKEDLPQNWKTVVGSKISIDVGANDNPIISVRSTKVMQTPKNTISNLNKLHIPKLDYNVLEKEFSLHVFEVNNSKDIRGVILGENNYDLIAEKLAADMESYYLLNKSKPKILKNDYYALYDEDWHRVKCLNIDYEKRTCTVLFVDRGDTDIVDSEKLYDLNPDFCELPAQAIRISLAGLEFFSNDNEMTNLVSNALIEKDIIVEDFAIAVDGNEEYVVGKSIFLNSIEEPIHLNEYIMDKILQTLDTAKFFDVEKLSVQQVHISCVNEGVYVQFLGKSMKYLQLLMEELLQHVPNFESNKINNKIDEQKMYLIQHGTDKNYYRARVEKELENNKIRIILVDFGSAMIISREELIFLEKNHLNTFENYLYALCHYPKQAHKVLLHKIPASEFNEKMKVHLRDIAKPTDVLYLKCVGDKDVAPRVELFKRFENNMLVSINDTLVLAPQISNDDENQSVKSEKQGSDSLKSPEIPKIDDYFDVHVTIAANPSNFTVQPYNSKRQLEAMTIELQKFCKNCSTNLEIREKQLCAAQYDDKIWYRGYISKIIDKDVVAIFFVDYGDYRPIQIENIKPLDRRFLALPYQAIKAKLYGIVPTLGDWSVDDCIRFHRMVVDKDLVAQIKNIETDAVTGEFLLTLDLFDTSTEDDINIRDCLENEWATKNK